MFLAGAASNLSARFLPGPGRARPPRQCRRELGTIGRPSGCRRANGTGTAMGAARAEDARQATTPVLGTVLRAMESVPLCVSPRLKVLGSGNPVERTLVNILLHGRDEVSEQARLLNPKSRVSSSTEDGAPVPVPPKRAPAPGPRGARSPAPGDPHPTRRPEP